MSYCRFIEADVYVFTSSAGIECCGCSLQEREHAQTTFGGPDANNDMITHLRVHQARGDYVPDDVFERLSDPEDATENQAIFSSRA